MKTFTSIQVTGSCALSSGDVSGPYSFKNALTLENICYLQMISFDVNHINLERVWFQLLRRKFNGQVIC